MLRVLNVYPQRKDQRIVDEATVCEGKRTTRRTGGQVFIRDQYTGALTSSTTEPVLAKKRYLSPEPVKKVTNRKRPRKKPSVLNDQQKFKFKKRNCQRKNLENSRPGPSCSSSTNVSFFKETACRTTEFDIQPTVRVASCRKRFASEESEDEVVKKRNRTRKSRPEQDLFLVSPNDSDASIDTTSTSSPTRTHSAIYDVDQNLEDMQNDHSETDATLGSSHFSTSSTLVQTPENEINEKELSTRPETAPTPVYVGKCIAVEENKFDYNWLIPVIRNLSSFQDSHEQYLPIVFDLMDAEMFNLIDEASIPDFYRDEVAPAIENYKNYRRQPEFFYDPSRGQYETYSVDGTIVEVPIPAKPEVFPSQIWKTKRRTLSREIAEQKQKEEDEIRDLTNQELERQQEAAKIIQEAYHAYLQAAMARINQNDGMGLLNRLMADPRELENYVRGWAEGNLRN